MISLDISSVMYCAGGISPAIARLPLGTLALEPDILPALGSWPANISSSTARTRNGLDKGVKTAILGE